MFKNIVISALLLFICVSCGQKKYTIHQDARTQYNYAKEKYDDRDYVDAVLEFQKVLFNFPGLSYIDSAQFWFAMSYYGQDEQHLAIAEFRRLINNFPSSELIDDGQLMIGKSYYEAAPGNSGLDQSDTKDAIKELKAFLEDYPNSNRRKEGEQMFSEAVEKIVKKQYEAGKQYFRMGNRISSRLYFEDIVSEYPESKYAPEALYLLAKIDKKENKYADGRDKCNNLLTAYPKSKIADKAKELRDELEILVTEEVNNKPDNERADKKENE